MPPDAHHGPAARLEALRSRAISLGIAADLVGPVLAIRTRSSAVGRATVPDTAVDEDCDLQPAKGQVWPHDSTALQDDQLIEAVADTQPMKRGAHSSSPGPSLWLKAPDA